MAPQQDVRGKLYTLISILYIEENFKTKMEFNWCIQKAARKDVSTFRAALYLSIFFNF